MLKVGITGGIGSGKSIVSKIIETLGFPVFNSDQVSKDLVNTDPEIKAGLIELFGKEIYSKDGVNKPLLAKIIFSDDKALTKVNALIHPKVRQAFTDFAENTSSPIVFNEAAILFETGANKQLDEMILVTAPEELRIKRVMSRDGVSEDEVKQRMNKQWSDDKKIELADFVLINDDKEPLLKQVVDVLSNLSKV
jgi:dephospho-CoA kinase